MIASVYASPTNPDPLPPSMLFRDPPDHTRLRALVTKAFTSRVVEAMRRHIQDIVDELLDRVLRTTTMDIIAELAYPLPVRVICEMLGVPVSDHATIRQWSADLARSLDAIGLQQRPTRNRVRLRMSAPRTPIPVRPTRVHEVPPARVFRGKAHLELGRSLREVGTRHPPVLLPPTTTYRTLLSQPDR